MPQFNLLQVHNLLSWKEHLQTLFAMKDAGQLKYVGITTSEGRRHSEVEDIMMSQPIDFVQIPDDDHRDDDHRAHDHLDDDHRADDLRDDEGATRPPLGSPESAGFWKKSSG